MFLTRGLSSAMNVMPVVHSVLVPPLRTASVVKQTIVYTRGAVCKTVLLNITHMMESAHRVIIHVSLAQVSIENVQSMFGKKESSNSKI